MKRAIVPIGVLIAVLLLAQFLPKTEQNGQIAQVATDSGGSSSSDKNSLYALIKKDVENESLGHATKVVKEFDKLVSNALKISTPDFSDKDIDAGIQGDAQTLCSKDRDGTYSSCTDLTQTIRGIAGRETNIQSLGRELQAIATSYELPLRDGQKGDAGVTPPLAGILNIWRVRGGKEVSNATGALLQRTMLVNANDSKGPAKEFAEAYEKLNDNEAINEEQKNAAIWRYTAGVRLVRNERKNYPAPEEVKNGNDSPERQYLFKRWSSLETPLINLWNSIRSQTFDPPLKPGEIVMFQFANEGMPDNVQLWGYVEQGKKKNDPLDGDVGVAWILPLNPIAPSLLKSDPSGGGTQAILGGAYPPEPVMAPVSASSGDSKPWDGRALCAGPTARFGYLCTPVPGDDICKEKIKAPADTIILSACTEPSPKTEDEQGWCCIQKKDGLKTLPDGGTCRPIEEKECKAAGGIVMENQNQCKQYGCTDVIQPDPKPIRQTVAGPDVCADLSWSTTQRCTDVQIECDNRSSDEIGSNDDFKWEGDKVTVLLLKQKNTAYPDILAHALTHVTQSCSMSPTPYMKDGEKSFDLSKLPKEEQEKRIEACCRTEGEAFAAQTLFMERAGRLKDAGTADGIPLNATTLAEGLTEDECHGFFPQSNGCRTSFKYTPTFKSEMWVFMNKLANDKDASSCEDVVKKAKTDPDVQGRIAAAKAPRDVCRPGAQTQFPNTIGNSLCFLGTCVENSTELRNTIPGRTATTVQDETFPFESTIKPLTIAADFLTGIPSTSLTLPAYRPALLLEQMDSELCQIVGLPLRYPSVRCMLEPNRQLQFPQGDYLKMTQSLTKSTQEQQVAIANREALLEATGIRIGTSLYGRVMDNVGHTLQDLVTTMNTLLETLQKTSFPTNMCPLGGTQ